MIDPQATGIAQRRAHGLNKGLIPGSLQPMWDERRQAPVLTFGIKLIRRGAN